MEGSHGNPFCINDIMAGLFNYFFFAMVTIFLLIYSFFKETRMKKNRKIL